MRRGLTCLMAAFFMVVIAKAAPVPNHLNPPKTGVKSHNSHIVHQPTFQTSRIRHLSQASAGKSSSQFGISSWYGGKFHGRKTASGERFDMHQFTAAHRKLPLGTWLKVTNLRNGKWVVVRVNDRGPVPQARILDLSFGAARMLNFSESGITRVRLDVVEEAAVRTMADEVALHAIVP